MPEKSGLVIHDGQAKQKCAQRFHIDFLVAMQAVWQENCSIHSWKK
jgi:cell wall assembly regulator SMI1